MAETFDVLIKACIFGILGVVFVATLAIGLSVIGVSIDQWRQERKKHVTRD